MALYRVIDREAEDASRLRLVKADSAAAALRHVAKTRFAVVAVTSAVIAADLLTSGIVMEVAGEEVPAPPPPAPPEDEDDDELDEAAE